MRWIVMGLVACGLMGCGGDTVSSGDGALSAGNADDAQGADAVAKPAEAVHVGDGSLDQCGVPGDLETLDSAATHRAFLVGRWLNCSGPGFFAKKEDGVEFTAEGDWHLLHRQADGTLARVKGFGSAGTWTLDPPQGPGYQAYVRIVDATSGGFNVGTTAFQSNPSAMRLMMYPGDTTDYVPAGD